MWRKLQSRDKSYQAAGLRPVGQIDVRKSSMESLVAVTRNQEIIANLLDSFVHEHPRNKNKVFSSMTIPDGSLTHTYSVEMMEQVETLLTQISSCLQLFGCPTHILEISMPKVSHGLGVDAEFAVLPNMTLMNISNNKKRKTLYFKTSSGINIYKLQVVDELVRRISSYASLDPLSLSTSKIDANERIAASLSPTDSEAVPVDASLNTLLHSEKLPSVLEIQEDGSGLERRKQIILDLASYGPGFMISRQLSITGDDTLMSATTPQGSLYAASPLAQVQNTFAMPEFCRSPTVASVPGSLYPVPDKRHVEAFAEIAVQDGLECLNQIIEAKPLYSKYMQWVLNSTAAAGCCVLFFNGNWIDMGFAAAQGFMVAVLGEFTKNARFTRLYEIFCAFAVSLITRLVHYYVVPLCYKAVTISAIIWLMQGVTITLAIIELMTRNLISGTGRLFYAITISALIGFGLDLGTGIFARIIGMSKSDSMLQSSCAPDRGMNPAFYPLFFIITSVSFNMLINTHWKQLLPMSLIAGIAYSVSYGLTGQLEDSMTSVLAALSVGIAANTYGKWSNTPAIIYVMSGLLMLVPGSMAVTGFFLFFQNDTTGGVGLATAVLMIALSLAIGIFLASLFAVQDDTIAYFEKLKVIQKRSNASQSGLIF